MKLVRVARCRRGFGDDLGKGVGVKSSQVALVLGECPPER